MPTTAEAAAHLKDDSEVSADAGYLTTQCFHELHGLNIRLSEGGTVATRTASFNDGIIFSERALRPNELFLTEIVKVDAGVLPVNFMHWAWNAMGNTVFCRCLQDGTAACGLVFQRMVRKN